MTANTYLDFAPVTFTAQLRRVAAKFTPAGAWSLSDIFSFLQILLLSWENKQVILRTRKNYMRLLGIPGTGLRRTEMGALSAELRQMLCQMGTALTSCGAPVFIRRKVAEMEDDWDNLIEDLALSENQELKKIVSQFDGLI